MFAIVNRLEAIPGYSHGTVVSVHRTELDALIADSQLHFHVHKGNRKNHEAPVFILPLAVHRKRGEHVRLSDLVVDGSDTQAIPRSLRLRREA